MTAHLHNRLLLLKALPIHLFYEEVYQTRFRKQYAKIVCFLTVLLFPFMGYAVFLTHKRKWVCRRKFSPHFATIKHI